MNEVIIKSYLLLKATNRNESQNQTLSKILGSSNVKHKKPISLIRQGKVKQTKLDIRNMKQISNFCELESEVQINLFFTIKQIDEIEMEDKKISFKGLDSFINDNIEVIKNIICGHPNKAKIFFKGVIRFLQIKLKNQRLVQYQDIGNFEAVYKLLKKISQEDNKLLKNDYQSCLIFNSLLLVLFCIKFYNIFQKDFNNFGSVELNQLIEGLSLIEKRSLTAKDEEFGLMKQMLQCFSYTLIFRESELKPQNFKDFILYGKKIFMPSKIAQVKLTQQQNILYYQTLQMYSLFIPQLSELLREIVFTCLQMGILVPAVRRHFGVIKIMIERRIFGDYQKVILKHFMLLTFTLQSLKFVSLLIEDLVRLPEGKQILNRCRQFLIPLGDLGVQMKQVLLQAYYQLTIQKGIKMDKSLFNALIEWNIQNQIIKTDGSGMSFFRQNIDLLNQNNIREIHLRSITKPERTLLILFLQEKIYRYVKKNQDIPQISKIFNKNNFVQLKTNIKSKQQITESIKISCTIYLELFIRIMTTEGFNLQYSYLKDNQNSNHIIQNIIKALQSEELQINFMIRYSSSSIYKIQQLYHCIFQIIKKNNIKDDYILTLMMISQSFFQDRQISPRWQYFLTQSICSRQITPLYKTLATVFKTKISGLCFLGYLVGLYLRSNSEKQVLSLMEPLQDIIQKDYYAFISMYAKPNIYTLIFLRQISTNTMLTKRVEIMLEKWKRFYSKYVVQLFYIFCEQNETYRSVVDAIKKGISKNLIPSFFYDRMKRVSSALNLAKQLNLKEEEQQYQQFEYLINSENQIVILPIHEAGNFEGIQLKISFLMNSSFRADNFVVFSGKECRYKLYFWGSKLAIYSKNSQVEDLKDLRSSCQNRNLKGEAYSKQHVHKFSKQLIQKNISVSVKLFGHKIFFSMFNEVIYTSIFKEPLQQIKIQLKKGLILRQMQITKGKDRFKVNLRTHYKIYENKIECKIKKLLSIKQQRFKINFDYETLFLLIKQLYKSSKQMKFHDYVSFLQYIFKYILSMGIIMMKRLRQGDRQYQKGLEGFYKLISSINLDLREIKKIGILELPELNIQNIPPTSLYQLLILTVVNKYFWLNCTTHSRYQLTKYLQSLFQNETPLKAVQNKSKSLFINLVQICQHTTIESNETYEEAHQDQLQQDIMSLFQIVLLTHEINPMLLWKFKHYFFISESNSAFKDSFSSFLRHLFDLLEQELAEQTVMRKEQVLVKKLKLKKKISKITYISTLNSKLVAKSIVTSPQILCLLLSSNLHVHERIFNIISRPCLALMNNFSQLMSSVSSNHINSIMKGLNNLFMKMLSEERQLNATWIEAGVEKIFSNWQMIDENYRQQFIRVITQIFKLLNKKNMNLQNQFFCTLLNSKSLLNQIIRIVSQRSIKNQMELAFTVSVLELFLKAPKKSLEIFLMKYRRDIAHSLETLLFLFEEPLSIIVHSLPLSSLSVFLNYLAQCTFLLKSGMHNQENKKQYSKVIGKYLLFIINNYESMMKSRKKDSSSISSETSISQKSQKRAIHNIPVNPILYAFPKIYHYQYFDSGASGNIFNDKLFQEIERNNNNLSQKDKLYGGVFFSLLNLSTQLLELTPETDFSPLLEALILKNIKMEESKSNIFKQESPSKLTRYRNSQQKQTISPKKNVAKHRALIDFPHVALNFGSQRNCIAMKMKQIEFSHLQYYSSTNGMKLMQKSEDKDLTPFFLDYFLLKLALHLEQYYSPNLQHYNSYNNLFYKALQCFNCLIEDVINQKNAQRPIFQTYEEFLKIYRRQQRKSRSTIKLQPTENLRQVIEKTLFNKQTMTPKKITRQKQQVEPSELSIAEQNEIKLIKQSGSKKRKVSEHFQVLHIKSPKNKNVENLIQMITYDQSVWISELKAIKFHNYFCQQAKELLFIEYLHYHFIDSNSQNQGQLAKKNLLLHKFISHHEKQLEEEAKIAFQFFYKKNKQSKSHEIKKIYPFTVTVQPVYKIKSLSLFQNQAQPLTVLSIKDIYSQKNHQLTHLIHQSERQRQQSPSKYQHCIIPKGEIDHDDNVVEQLSLENIKSSNQSYFPFCEVITRKGAFFGDWLIEQRTVIISTYKQKPIDDELRELKYGSPSCNIIRKKGKKMKIQIQEIKEIFYRKFNQIQGNALEIFLKSGKSFFICFYTKKNSKNFIRKIKEKKIPSSVKIVQLYEEQFERAGYTDKWANGQISNFDYLMVVNKYSGRSYSDLNQYYIFPWVLCDYSSKTLNLSDPNIYRDLTKPVGALNQRKLQRFHEKLNCMSKINKNKSLDYLYGSHYSTSLFIFYYMVRIQPYTSLHREMQSGSFDSPDRIFNSIQQMWQCLMSQTNTSDIKQSIPEFYYFPTFLRNVNKLNIGTRQSGQHVGDVQLPRWASSPQDFIIKMRAALQSDFVSAMLPHWIDLIFGKFQRSFQKNNVFHPYSYVQNGIDLNSISVKALEATICQIAFFGQCPLQLFSQTHVRKKIHLSSMKTSESDEASRSKKLSQIEKYPIKSLFYQLDIRNYFVEVTQVGKSIFFTLSSLRNKRQNSQLQSHEFDFQRQQTSNLAKFLRRLQDLTNSKMQSDLKKYHIDKKPIKSQIISLSKKDIFQKMNLNYDYNSYLYNEMIIVLYGKKGLRILNWQYQTVMDYITMSEQISNCYIDDLTVIFSTSGGKCYLYDMLSRKRRLVYNFQNATNEEKNQQKNHFKWKCLFFHQKRTQQDKIPSQIALDQNLQRLINNLKQKIVHFQINFLQSNNNNRVTISKLFISIKFCLLQIQERQFSLNFIINQAIDHYLSLNIKIQINHLYFLQYLLMKSIYEQAFFRAYNLILFCIKQIIFRQSQEVSFVYYILN